ncbi:hypothetical protein CUU66_08995 [Peribacillus deserti]|uniref:Uncharacterized protein n=1 Tax=Peribacillus deserti TaxID=673318 RepID=A0A2N5M738_9BACI|nr:hypothetical protein CUU66_08995 [Peribacillus deserti]
MLFKKRSIRKLNDDLFLIRGKTLKEKQTPDKEDLLIGKRQRRQNLSRPYHAPTATSCGPAWLAHPVLRALARHKTSGSKRPIFPFNGDWLMTRGSKAL